MSVRTGISGFFLLSGCSLHQESLYQYPTTLQIGAVAQIYLEMFNLCGTQVSRTRYSVSALVLALNQYLLMSVLVSVSDTPVMTSMFNRNNEMHKYRTRHAELLHVLISQSNILYKTIRHCGVTLVKYGKNSGLYLRICNI